MVVVGNGGMDPVLVASGPSRITYITLFWTHFSCPYQPSKPSVSAFEALRPQPLGDPGSVPRRAYRSLVFRAWGVEGFSKGPYSRYNHVGLMWRGGGLYYGWLFGEVVI